MYGLWVFSLSCFGAYIPAFFVKIKFCNFQTPIICIKQTPNAYLRYPAYTGAYRLQIMLNVKHAYIGLLETQSHRKQPGDSTFKKRL